MVSGNRRSSWRDVCGNAWLSGAVTDPARESRVLYESCSHLEDPMSTLRRFCLLVTTLLTIGCGAVPPLTPTPTASGSMSGTTAVMSRITGSSVACRGGKSPEYWAAHVQVITEVDLDVFASQPLQTASGSRFVPSGPDSIASWLKNGSKSIDLYGLSVQLAVAILNVRHGYVDVNASAVLIQQAQIQLTLSTPSPGWTEELVREFNRCQ